MDQGRDTTRLGILLMVGFCVMAPLSEAFVKMIGTALPLMQVVLVRFLAPLVLIRPRLWRDRAVTWQRPGVMPLVMLRGVLHLTAISCFFLSLRYLPLADALAIAYVMPFFIISVGWFTGEPPSRVQAAMCLVGFIGTLLVVQPSFARVGWPALLPVAVAVVFTGFIFITRRLTRTIDPIDLQAMNGIAASAVLVPIVAMGTVWGWSEVRLVPIDAQQFWWLCGVGFIGTLGHLSMTWGLKLAPPSTLAPVQYLEIAFGAAFGWLFFKDLPNGLAALGILVVVGAGLMVLFSAPPAQKPAPNPADS